MILKKIFIKNFFAFSGEIELDLEPKNNKNITLIGARNGRGKTSFLRIIKILIHGLKDNSDFTKQDAKLNPNEYALGKGNKWEGIFNKTIRSNTASVKGIFDLDGKELIINREFEKRPNTFKEEITVNYNNKEKINPQVFLNNILPKNFAQFFFFDGEKLEDLINTQSLNVKDSLEVLLNIKTYEKLIDSIKSVKSGYKKDTVNTPTSDEIEKLEHNRNSLISDIKISKNDILTIEKEIKIFKIDIEETGDKLTDLLADYKANTKPLKPEKDKIDKELVELREYITKKIKGIDFLVLMTESISRNYLSKLEDENTNHQLDEQLKNFSDNLRNMIRRIQDNLFKIDDLEYNIESYKVDFYKDRLDDLRKEQYEDFSKRMRSNNQEQIIHFNEDDKNRLHNVFEEKTIMYEKFSHLQNIEKRLKQITSELENETENASENNSLINSLKLKKNELENKKSDNEQKIGELTKDIEVKTDTKNSLDVKIKNLEKTLNLSQPILNSINLSDKLIVFFQEFKLKLLRKKIEDLENAFNDSLHSLAHDKDWIKMVEINDKFEIKLFNYLEMEISINSQSSGQKQILATALIQALGIVSEVKSFICIDTPLSRIDNENREQFITKYYPKASKQVIILSTNSEIDPSKSEYRYMKDFISKEYTITTDKYSSSFEEGYFNEISRG